MEISCPHCAQRNRIAPAKLAANAVCGKCREPLLNAPLDIDGHDLEELIEDSALPLLVDFWAPWCAPCRGFAPTFKAAAAKFGGQLLFVKLDTEAHPAAGHAFNIRSIPTLAVFHRGQELGRVSGALPMPSLQKLIEDVLAQLPQSRD